MLERYAYMIFLLPPILRLQPLGHARSNPPCSGIGLKPLKWRSSFRTKRGFFWMILLRCFWRYWPQRTTAGI
jgi:hypothetical protein